MLYIGEENSIVFPLALETIWRDFYTDDLLTGAKNLGQAVQLMQNIVSILSQGGFGLDAWYSNNATL